MLALFLLVVRCSPCVGPITLPRSPTTCLQQAHKTNFNMKKDTICLSEIQARAILLGYTSSHSRRLIFVVTTERNRNCTKKYKLYNRTVSEMQTSKLHLTVNNSEPKFKTGTPTSGRVQIFGKDVNKPKFYSERN